MTATTVPTGKPAWSREAAIGDYGGSLTKREALSEADGPPSWFWYRELQATRGTAYSTSADSLVHCENLALARFYGWWASRVPESVVANSLPESADDALDYWVEVLGVPVTENDADWVKRQACAAHYRAAPGLTLETIEVALQELLGDAFVSAEFNSGASLASPPTLTFWPGVNPGASSYSLGRGCWASERSHLFVEVTQPSGVTDGAFNQLVNVKLYQLLDRMLPAFCTFSWARGTGFQLDISQLDFVGLLPS